MRTYVGMITVLALNQVFVFGSNTQGRHGKGSALFAKQNCGAIYGQAYGLQGQSYAIVTKDLTKAKHPSISLFHISEQVYDLYELARRTPEKEYVVAYSGKGANLNGYSPQQLAVAFGAFGDVPDNMVFEKEFGDLIDLEIAS